MNHLQAGIELAFAVFPEAAALIQPAQGAFDNPSFRKHGKGVQLISLDDFNGGLDPFHHAVGKRLARVAAVYQHALDQLQIWLASIDGPQSAVAVGHIGRGYGRSVGKPLRVHRDMPLDAGDLLARVVTLLAGRVGVFHALRVSNDEAGLRLASKFCAGLANGFFLRPAPGRLLPLHRARSTWQNTNTR